MPVTYDLITETILTANATTVTFSSISSSYDVLMISYGSAKGNQTGGLADAFQMRYNADSSSVYHQHRNYHSPLSGFGGDSGINENAQNCNTINSTGNGDTIYLTGSEYRSGGLIVIPNANNSGQYKRYIQEGNAVNQYYYNQWGGAEITSVVSSIVLHCQLSVPGQFVTGTRFRLYGLVRA